MNASRVIGIDPGLRITGYGIVDCQNKKTTYITSGIIKTTSEKLPYPERLKIIFDEVSEIISQYQPNQMCIEKTFVNMNANSSLALGQARGVAMAAGLYREVPITEYSPKKIKMAITGNGNATKEQVAKMLQNLLNIKELPKNLDATDGLAAAVCHFFNQGRAEKNTTYTGWQAFVNQNPNKIKS